MVCVRRLKDDPLFGVDSRWSWITALFCSWVLFFSMATIRIGGIFFYGIVETFGVTRAEASWPVSLAGTIMVMGGPIAGYLCRRFTCRAVLLVCSSLVGTAASLCYLAKSLLFITISFGFVHGGAMCGLFVSCNVLVAQHFEKRRATATSLMFTVFGLNSVAISPLLEFFRKTYGVRGAFLLYGALLLNAIPAVIVLRRYFRDTYGDYTGLLHLMAALNASFVCIWTFKLVTMRKSRTNASSPPTPRQA
ncbi:monocarboxylate transporter 4-like [Dermacentor albipictus]|uniref:monocarboxylate transporter 4-like n=1 Tax=Dermacentor albipictus TaxID=60249 RepID=UPI0038FC703F